MNSVLGKTFFPDRWGGIVLGFSALSEELPWIESFRLTYYLDSAIYEGPRPRKKARLLVGSIIGCTRLLWNQLLLCLRARAREIERPQAVVLLSSNPGYWETLEPVVRQMLVNVQGLVFFTSRADLAEIRRRIGRIPGGKAERVLAYEDFADSKELAEGWGEFLNGLRAALRALVYWIRKAPFRSRFWQVPRLIQFAFVAAFHEPILGRILEQCRVVVAANDHYLWEAATCRAARSVGCPSLVLEHGVIGEYAYPLIASRFLVWGRRDREIMTRLLGARDEQILVVGSPKFDDIGKRAPRRVNPVRDKVVFLSQSHGATQIGEPGYISAVRMFFALAGKCGGRSRPFVIKLHPHDSLVWYRSRFGTACDGVVFSEGELLPLLDSAAVCVTVDSTAILEAAMLGVPVVQLDPPGLKRFIDFSPTKIAYCCSSADELETTVSEVLSRRDGGEVTNVSSDLGLVFENQGKSVEAFMSLISSYLCHSERGDSPQL